MTTDVAERRSSIENQLEELRSRRGEGLLDGRGFNAQSTMTKLANELAGLDDMEAVQHRRERVDAQAQRKAQVEKLKENLVQEEAKRLRAIDEAQIALNTYFEQIEKFFGISAGMAAMFHSLHRSGPPMPLNAFEIARRVAGTLGAKMTQLMGHREKLGPIVWSGHSLYDPASSWRDREERLLKPTMNQILKRD